MRSAQVHAVLSLAASVLLGSNFFGASLGSSLDKAKASAVAKGYLFAGSHDEIVARAKGEGKLRVLSSLDPEARGPMAATFKKKYPFVDIAIEEITGTETVQRHLLEVKAGAAGQWDITHVTDDFYNDFAPLGMKVDLLGMAEQGVVAVNPRMVDPQYRNMAAVSTAICAIAYNKNLLPTESVPAKLEDFLRPELKGRKFLVDIRPHCMASLIPGMGEEWVLNYARKIKEQQPIFARGNTRALTAIAVGEYGAHQLTNYHSCLRAAQKDRTQTLTCKVVEPVSARIQELELILKTAANPCAALLFIEHTASPEGQKIIDQFEPMKSSIYGDGEIARLLKGKKVSLNDFGSYAKAALWMEKIIEAYGFPKAEVK